MKMLKTGFLLVTLIVLFSVNVNSQAIKNYEPEWKKVTDLVNKGLPKSALPEVKKIYELAKKENQDAQVIKALVYMTSLQDENRENNETLSIYELEKETANLTTQRGKESSVAILNSLLAQGYWSYYQQNRWNFYSRTETKEFKKEDISTWAPEDFFKKVSSLYLASVANERLLQQTRLEPFDVLIQKGNMRHLRPTLFDLLVNRAISFFEIDERDLHKPAYAFEIDKAAAFDPAVDFVKFKFVTKDSLSLHYKALVLYQHLLAFHLNDAKPDALIDADLQRIEFVNAKSVHPDKDQLYLAALNHIVSQYPNLPAATQASYLVASYYENKARLYQPYGDSSHRLDRVKAKEICEKVLAQKDSSEGKINCYNLLQQINAKTLRFSVEKVNIPGDAFRALVNYRNISTVYLRLIKATDALKNDMENRYEDKYWNSMLAAAPLKTWQQALPVTKDLQEHRTEIKIDGLPAGEYILVALSDKEYNKTESIMGARLFYVSNISFVTNHNDIFVLNRQTGQPLAGASVQVWEQRYDYKTSRYIKEKAKLYKADANGYFKSDQKDEKQFDYSYLLDINYNNERLFMTDLVRDYFYLDRSDETTVTTSAFYFTDRSIYRPGQILYFKGIVLTRSGKTKNNIQAGYKTTVYLRDANSQLLDSLVLTSNEYGSFSGKFQLPQTGLTGMFSIYSQKPDAAAWFNVEEYKRPKFYVDYETLKNTYKLNDQVKVTGFAKAYAGNDIDGATVKYRVVRQSRFLYPWMYYKWWFPPAEPMEIAHGETTTDAQGKFTVEFTAIPDLKMNKSKDLVFDYEVFADVTDINGETRSGSQSVSVSYKSLFINASLPEKVSVDSLQTVQVRTENMNGEYQPSMVKVAIYSLKEENRLIRSRFWERPDQFVMAKQEYIRNFPNDEYDNESDYRSWETNAKVFEKTDSARENSKFSLTGLKIIPGIYMVEFTTKDKSGEEVKDIKYIELYNENNELSKPAYLWADGAKPIEPGQTTSVKLGTSADNVFVVQMVDKQLAGVKPMPAFSFFKLNN